MLAARKRLLLWAAAQHPAAPPHLWVPAWGHSFGTLALKRFEPVFARHRGRLSTLSELATGTHASPLCAVAITPKNTLPVRGDANRDRVISWRDIDYCVAAQSNNESARRQKFPPGTPACTFANCDVNADGNVSWRDINPFVALMNTTCP